MDPDPWGPKAYGSDGSGSATLFLRPMYEILADGYLSAMVGLVALLIGFLRHIPEIMPLEHSQIYMISLSRELLVYSGCHNIQYLSGIEWEPHQILFAEGSAEKCFRKGSKAFKKWGNIIGGLTKSTQLIFPPNKNMRDVSSPIAYGWWTNSYNRTYVYNCVRSSTLRPITILWNVGVSKRCWEMCG